MSDYSKYALDHVELRQLEAFRAIAQAGSFHGAASELGMSQSVMSQHLASLEKAVGLRLIERGRGRRHTELTQAGNILIKYVQTIEANLGAASADLQQLRDGRAGIIRVGTFQSVSARILPKLLSRYAKEFPQVTVQIHESRDDQELLPLLETGELDFAFTALPLAPGPFEAVAVIRDPWVLLTQVDSPLATRKSALSVSALENIPLIGFGATGIVQTQLEEYMRGHGLNPNIVFRSNDNVAVAELVASGFASAVLPALTVYKQDKRVVRIPMDIPTRTLALAWNEHRTQLPAAQTFVSLVKQICKELSKAE